MLVSVRLPAMLGGAVIAIRERVETIDELVTALDHAQPGIATELRDTIFNFAVNDEMLLHDAGRHRLKDGDVVEIVPAISGG